MRNIIIYIFLILLISACNNSSQESENSTTENSDVVQRYLDKLKDKEKRAGLGFLVVEPSSFTKDMEFYADLQLKFKVGEFNPNQPNEDIKPEYYDKKNKICYFTCLGYNRRLYTISINKETLENRYLPLDTTKYRFVHWEEFFSNANEVERVDNKNRLLAKPAPKHKTTLAKWDDGSQNKFEFLEYRQKWIKVKELDGENEGWLQWADFDKLLLKLHDEDFKNLKNMKLGKDRVKEMFPKSRK